MLLGRSKDRRPIIRRHQLYLSCIIIHFFFLISVSFRDILSLVAGGYTFLPQSFQTYASQAHTLTAAGLGQTLDTSHPLRQIVSSYLHSAGIQVGYCFFAPGVPNSYKLVFELHHRDGRIDYELPTVSGDAAGVRLVTLLDHIGETQYDALREVMLKMLAYATWQKHSDVTAIRAVFGYIEEPTAREATRGRNEIYKFVHAYDFSFAQDPMTPPKR